MSKIHTVETGYGVIGIVNCTPHPIRFSTVSGNVEIPASGKTLLATAKEAVVDSPFGGCFQAVKTVFEPSEQGLQELEELESLGGGIVIVGSIISAQAYPGRVYSLVPAEGFERVAPADKLYRVDKFNRF